MTRHRDVLKRDARRAMLLGAIFASAALAPQAALPAAQPASFLDSVHRQTTLASTVPDNGDQNPYAIVVAPVSAGTIQKDDVLVTNFNNAGNLQGLGTTSSTTVRRPRSSRPSQRCRAISRDVPAASV